MYKLLLLLITFLSFLVPSQTTLFFTIEQPTSQNSQSSSQPSTPIPSTPPPEEVVVPEYDEKLLKQMKVDPDVKEIPKSWKQSLTFKTSLSYSKCQIMKRYDLELFDFIYAKFAIVQGVILWIYFPSEIGLIEANVYFIPWMLEIKLQSASLLSLDESGKLVRKNLKDITPTQWKELKETQPENLKEKKNLECLLIEQGRQMSVVWKYN